MSAQESTIRKKATRLGAGLLGLTAALGANELIKPDRPAADPIEDAGKDTTGDSGMDTSDTAPKEVALPTRTEAPASLSEKINGADSTLQKLFDDGYKDFTIASDGDTMEVYNTFGERALVLKPDGNRWKVSLTNETLMSDWSTQAGIGLVEPSITSGDGVQEMIDAYQELYEWRRSWTSVETNGGLFGLIGTDQLPATQASLDEIQAKQEDELAKLESIIINSDNPLIDHSDSGN